MLNKTIFAQNMAMLCEVYDKELTKPLQSVYYAILKDMLDEDFKQAIKRLLQERVFATFPKPAEILERTNIKEVAIVEVDDLEIEAKRLIELVKSMNEAVYQKHIKTGYRYDDCLNAVKFETVDDETKAILNQVKPHCDFKILIGNINTYQTSKEQLKAFMNALKHTPEDSNLIGNPIERLRIKR